MGNSPERLNMHILRNIWENFSLIRYFKDFMENSAKVEDGKLNYNPKGSQLLETARLGGTEGDVRVKP